MARARTFRRRYDAEPGSVRRARDDLACFTAAAGGNADQVQDLAALPEHSGLGLGLELIDELADEMTLADRAVGGSELRMRFAFTDPRRRSRSPRVRRRQPAAAAAA